MEHLLCSLPQFPPHSVLNSIILVIYFAFVDLEFLYLQFQGSSHPICEMYKARKDCDWGTKYLGELKKRTRGLVE